MHPVAHITVKRIQPDHASEEEDSLAVEQPLEIAIEYNSLPGRIQQAISITMRTPGNDDELAAGFLFTEGIIRHSHEVREIMQAAGHANQVLVRLHDTTSPTLPAVAKSFVTTSACGVCGKQDIDAIRTVSIYQPGADSICIDAAVFYGLQDELKKQQWLFKDTGGIHAAALFDLQGNYLQLREDVGRHNALDKVIGAAFLNNQLPLCNAIVLLSGRASFELLQKAFMAGIKIVAAVGAPSSLAVELAREYGITLIGFLRNERFNIYSGAQRVRLQH
jgi:FdhD protein